MTQRSPAPLLAIGTLLFICGAALAGYFLLRSPEPTAIDESPDQKKSAVREAFVEPPDAAVDDPEQGINALLESLGKALHAGDGNRAVQHYDYGLMIAAADQQGLVPATFRLRRSEMAMRMGQDQATKLTETGKFQAWVRHRIVGLRYLKGREEAVVYARHVDADGVVSKMRWWVVKREDAWRVYDSEDLSLNLRLSTAAGMGLAAADQNATWGPSLRTIYEALQLFAAKDFQGAHDKLQGLEGVGFPPPLEGLRLFMLGSCQVALLEHDKALATFDRAGQLDVDMPILHYNRMAVFNLEEQYDKAIAEGKPYLDALGPDADVDLELGFAHARLGHAAEAEKHLTRCLDDVPNQADCLRHLAALLPQQRTGEFQQRLMRVEDVNATARLIIETALENENHDAARMVIRALESSDPKHPLVVEFAPKLPPAKSQ